MKRTACVALAFALLAGGPAGAPKAQQALTDNASPSGVALVPTSHAPLSRELSQLWMAPDQSRSGRTAALEELASAVKLEAKNNYAKALPMLSQPALQQGPLGQYAKFYEALAELRLGHPDEARRAFQALQLSEPVGYLAEAAAHGEAECDEALGDHAAALDIYERLSASKPTAPDEVLIRAGKAAKAAGDLEKAKTAFERVYYEFPFSDQSPVAAAEIDWFYNGQPIVAGGNRYKLELGRAERLFGSRRFAEARSGFEAVRSSSQGDDREVVTILSVEHGAWIRKPL